MKKLSDRCLDIIAVNLFGNISSLVQNMSFYHKEILLERLVAHDYLIPSYLPHVTYNLFCSSLKKLCFYYSDQVTDLILETLKNTGCQLIYLRITECPYITDCGINHIASNLCNLESLKLVGLSKLTGVGLHKISSNSLKKVIFNECKNLTSQNLVSFFKSNYNIVKLSLCACKSLDLKVFDIILNLTELEELNLNEFHHLDDASLIKVANACTHIKKLYLLGCNLITYKSLSVLISKCVYLTDLDISYCSKLNTINSLLILKKCENLTSLSLVGIQLVDEDILIDIISNLPKIRDLKLAGVAALTDKSLLMIMKCVGKQLTTFNLNGSIDSSVSDIGLEAISQYCTSLTYLGLSMLKISGITLLPLFNNPKLVTKLVELHISSTNVLYEILQIIAAKCTSLTYLSVTAVKLVDDDFLTLLANNCKCLTGISLKNCRLVTDEGVIQLAINCPLESLVISGVNNLTDACINVMRDHCCELKELYLAGCSLITKEALERLKNAVNWRLYILHM